MEWIIAALAVVVVGIAAAASVGKLGHMPEEPADTPGPTLSGPLTSEALGRVKFGTELRGYNMAQVDALLQHVAQQLPSGESLDNLEPDNLIVSTDQSGGRD